MRFHPAVPLLLNAVVFPAVSGLAGDTPPPVSVDTAGKEDVFSEWVSPHFHAFGVVGDSTADPVSLAVGHHDPHWRGWNLNQGLEGGFSLKGGEWLEGFVNGLLAHDRDESEWTPEMEEAFGKIRNLPGGFELRGGRYLNRFGRQNALHPHGYDFVDQNLTAGEFLGEDGLSTDGGEISWVAPEPFSAVLSVSYGKRTPGDDHEHAHGHEEHEFEAGDANFATDVLSVRSLVRHSLNDFHQFSGGLSWARGENGFGRTTNVFGLDLEYQWRENGLEPGGRAFRWNNEFFFRRAEVMISEHGLDEQEHEHSGEPGGRHEEESTVGARAHESGFTTSTVYTVNPRLDLGLRADWVEGLGGDSQERWRLSPAVTFRPDKNRRSLLRLQYNLDHRREEGVDHSVWLQLGFNFGGAEVR